MALIGYNRPSTDIMSKRFSDIMDEFFKDVVTTKRDTFIPELDISETDNEFRISVELPGMKKEDIDVSLDNGRLTISGERKFEEEEEGETYHRIETKYGKFNRSFQLPDSVKEESIEASYENGMLDIRIKKQEEQPKKKIEIS